ncbi:MAG: replisome organizer [Clostridia bacterium]|nr:replisome organizer [Clostridia bacterium]
MFAKTIIDSDAFLEMPVSAQLLYFHLSMRADDDGFINKPKAIMRMCGAKDDDINLLFIKKFIIPFESGVVVIKHWKIHNYIRKDTYIETKYKEEKSLLELDENSSYRLIDASPSRVRYEAVTSPSTQDRIVKESIVKDNLNIYSASPTESPKPSAPKKHKYGEYKNVLLSDADLEKLKEEFPRDYEKRIENLSAYIASTGKSYKSHLATIRNWARRDEGNKPEQKSESSFDVDDFFEAALKRSWD